MVPRIAAAAILDRERERLMLLVGLHRHGANRSRQRLRQRLDPLAVGEERLVPRVALEQLEDHVARRAAPLDDLQVLAERDQLLEPLFELLAANLGPVGQHERRATRRRA